MKQKIENERVIQIGKLSDIITVLSFLIGTIILVLYFIPIQGIDFEIILTGYFYVIITIIINLIMLIGLIISIFSFQNYQKYLLKRIGFLLLNIPITILYFLIFLYSENVLEYFFKSLNF